MLRDTVNTDFGEAAGMTVYRINVDDTKPLEETADWIAMSISSVLDQMFPDQHQEAMRLVVQRLNMTVGQETGRSAWCRRSS